MFPLAIVIFFLGVCAYVYYGLHQASSSADPFTLTVKEGEGVSVITDRLEAEGVISRGDWLAKYLQLKGVDKKIQVGVFTLTPPFSIVHIAEQFGHPEKNEKTITLLPGWDLREIVAYLVNQGFGTEEQFFALTGKSATAYSKPVVRPESIASIPLYLKLPKTASLEGYLAPDTYRVYANATPEDIIKKLFIERDSQFTDQMYKDIAAQKRTVHEVMTMASILEREVRTDEERKKVADLFWRRYDMGWALQADSTVHYLTNKKGDVYTTSKDRQTDSPWNTYKYKELPPGPISTPSISSIMAAIYPEKNDYWYFLTTFEGRVVYAKTLEQHNANKVHLE